MPFPSISQASAGYSILRARPTDRAAGWSRLHDHRSDRKQFFDINSRVLAAIDELPREWQQQHQPIVQAVAADVRALINADVRRIVLDELHKLNEGRKG
jgi:hypothetical protein